MIYYSLCQTLLTVRSVHYEIAYHHLHLYDNDY